MSTSIISRPDLTRTLAALAAYDEIDREITDAMTQDEADDFFKRSDAAKLAIGDAFALDTADRNEPEVARSWAVFDVERTRKLIRDLLDARTREHKSPLSPPLVTAFTRTLERVGWQLLAVDIDMVKETARIELRQDGLHVTFDARNGKATTTRERVRLETERRGRKGDIFIAEVLRMEFIGRAHHEGVRSGLRWLTTYIADNSKRAISAGEVRLMLAPLMSSGVEEMRLSL